MRSGAMAMPVCRPLSAWNHNILWRSYLPGTRCGPLQHCNYKAVNAPPAAFAQVRGRSRDLPPRERAHKSHTTDMAIEVRPLDAGSPSEVDSFLRTNALAMGRSGGAGPQPGTPLPPTAEPD